jgi:hypothetical protein
MEENKFWIAIWKTIVIGVCAFAALVSGCNGMINYQDNTAIVEMVAKGADPLDAQCAVKEQNSSCFIRAATKNK